MKLLTAGWVGNRCSDGVLSPLAPLIHYVSSRSTRIHRAPVVGQSLSRPSPDHEATSEAVHLKHPFGIGVTWGSYDNADSALAGRPRWLEHHPIRQNTVASIPS